MTVRGANTVTRGVSALGVLASIAALTGTGCLSDRFGDGDAGLGTIEVPTPVAPTPTAADVLGAAGSPAPASPPDTGALAGSPAPASPPDPGGFAGSSAADWPPAAAPDAGWLAGSPATPPPTMDVPPTSDDGAAGPEDEAQLVFAGEPIVFTYTGSPQTWLVPDGVAFVAADVQGAQGGGNGPDVPGGYGARVQTLLAVMSGETLVINVGGAGGDLVLPNTGGEGGWNGGGAGGVDNVDGNGPGAGGGGASDMRQGGDDLLRRVVVAGGGGGSEGWADGFGGDGAGVVGASGTCLGSECSCAAPGGGATQAAGGVGGAGCNGNGSAGSLGQGGGGGNGNRAGGGGGGGHFGGGGGGGCCLGAGGGGGSSYSSATRTQYTQGYRAGNGLVILFTGSIVPNRESP